MGFTKFEFTRGRNTDKCRLFGEKAGGDNKWEFEFEKPLLTSSEISGSTPKKRKTCAFGRT